MHHGFWLVDLFKRQGGWFETWTKIYVDIEHQEVLIIISPITDSVLKMWCLPGAWGAYHVIRKWLVSPHRLPGRLRFYDVHYILGWHHQLVHMPRVDPILKMATQQHIFVGTCAVVRPRLEAEQHEHKRTRQLRKSDWSVNVLLSFDIKILLLWRWSNMHSSLCSLS